MEQMSTLLQGGYAYLLIFQILVVSSLFVMLTVMVLRRLKLETVERGPAVNLEASIPSGVTADEHEKLKATLDGLTDDLKNVDKLKADNSALNEKVKFLESKLLEYEILQEEIGSLSNLKVENEKLKKELLDLQKDIGKTGAQIEQMVQEAPSAVAPPSASPFPVEILGAETASIATASPPTSTEVVPPPQPEASAIPSPPSDGPNLDGLLAEIDALSAKASGQSPKA